MGELGRGEGEALERARRRRRSIIIAVIAIFGVVAGFYGGWSAAEAEFDLSKGWSPTASLLTAVLYVAAMLLGGFALGKQMDEVEIQTQYKAGSLAGGVYALVYPTWFFLWMGGFVIEPIHWVLFLIFWLALAVSSLYYRYR